MSFQKGNKNMNIFIKMYIFHWFQTMNAGQNRRTRTHTKKKFPALYENIPQVPTLFIMYRQTAPTASFPLHRQSTSQTLQTGQPKKTQT